jgi:hypothetical protein
MAPFHSLVAKCHFQRGFQTKILHAVLVSLMRDAHRAYDILSDFTRRNNPHIPNRKPALPLRITWFLDCPLFDILKTRINNVSETVSASVLRWGEKTLYLLGSLERSNLDHFLKDPNTVSPPHLGTEIDPVSKTLFNAGRWTKYKPSNSEYYTPSSEPFRIYYINFLFKLPLPESGFRLNV